MSDSKPTNPKDIIGSGKLPLGLAPDTIEAEVALAYLEGALKYGRCNWRIAGVRASVYNDAARRHIKKWWNGENHDPKTRVKHLASAIACLGILLDAELCQTLTDDRPPSAPIGKLIDESDEIVAHLKEMFKDHDPRHYTIADSLPIPSHGLAVDGGQETRAPGGRDGAGEVSASDNGLRPDSSEADPDSVPSGGEDQLDEGVQEVLDAYFKYYAGSRSPQRDELFVAYNRLFLRLTAQQKDKFNAFVREVGCAPSRRESLR